MIEDESPGLSLDLPEQMVPSIQPAAPYRVLARKYRPQNFSELIGQDAMVRTLGNAIASGRIAHAFLLTGVRGVGKTSTARLVAKALNCIGIDGQGGPTIDPCGVCEPCRAIAEGRYIDVIEMDAASNTGVDDVREIIEGVRYAAVSARYKIYIIDEVHMLSKNAFNALLKTLEEPPAHVKFLFATTEVAKVPVTVLSRCQRFDLRRISAEALAAHFEKVARAEGIEVEPEALAVIARAAEGSARDGLSILDQAIAHGSGMVTASEVRGMLGLADRSRVRSLFAALLEGDSSTVLESLDEAYALGIDPGSLVRGLMEAVHSVSRAKAGSPGDVLQSVEERDAAAGWSGKLSWVILHRLWQMLLKGFRDIEEAPDPHEAAAMALLRLVHAADLPDPATLLARLRDGDNAAAAPASATKPAAAAASSAVRSPLFAATSGPGSFRDLIALVDGHGRRLVAQQLHDQVGLVRFAPGEIVLRPCRPLGPDWARDLAATLKSATGTAWQVSLSDEPGEPSLLDQEKMAEQQARDAILAEPSVAAVFAQFPDATLTSITAREA